MSWTMVLSNLFLSSSWVRIVGSWCVMVNELKSRLQDWLDGKTDLNAFRTWFFETAKLAHVHGEEFEALVDCVGVEFASYANGSTTAEHLRENLRRLAQRSPQNQWSGVYDVQYVLGHAPHYHWSL